jgi:hypothetical protein
MTMPGFATVAPYDPDADKRIYLPLGRTKGKLLIVKPTKYQAEGFITEHKPEGTDVVFADIALLDPIRAAVNEDDEELPAIDAPQAFRGQSVLQGYLKGTFKRYIDQILIGMIYNGPKTKGKPPMMWQDLSGDAGCVQRGQQWLIANPSFLLPPDSGFVAAEPEVPAGPPAYTPPPLATGSVVSKPLNTLEQMRAMANGGDIVAPF